MEACKKRETGNDYLYGVYVSHCYVCIIHLSVLYSVGYMDTVHSQQDRLVQCYVIKKTFP